MLLFERYYSQKVFVKRYVLKDLPFTGSNSPSIHRLDKVRTVTRSTPTMSISIQKNRYICLGKKSVRPGSLPPQYCPSSPGTLSNHHNCIRCTSHCAEWGLASWRGTRRRRKRIDQSILIRSRTWWGLHYFVICPNTQITTLAVTYSVTQTWGYPNLVRGKILLNNIT